LPCRAGKSTDKNRIPADEINQGQKHSEEREYYRDKYDITIGDVVRAIDEKS